VKAALDIGYRHVDTAEMYGNEQEVGQGIVEAVLDRASVFMTSKLNNGFHRPDDARRAFVGTLSVIGDRRADGVQEVRFSTAPGDYVFVPPYVPHRKENPDHDHPEVIVIARSTQEAIVVNVPELYALSESTSQ
jgi:aryl-alcohol dehydrogenase-like predicted oxidoreductase